MKKLTIKRILVPTDFSETSLLALEHAAFMARLHKADLFLLHAIEISDTTYSIYEPAIVLKDLSEVENVANEQLGELAAKLKKQYAITVKTICTHGRSASEIVSAVNENEIDIVVMGTHGAHGFNEFFVGSNTHKTITVCPCPVISVQSHAKKIGFTNIVLPIDKSPHSRQKVDQVISLAKKYASKIHILGLLDNLDELDKKKFNIKLEAVEKAVNKAGLVYECKTVKEDNLAVAAMKYSKKVKADLIVVLTGHESNLTGMFVGPFSKQIINHSKIPVMSIREIDGEYDMLSLAGATPF